MHAAATQAVATSVHALVRRAVVVRRTPASSSSSSRALALAPRRHPARRAMATTTATASDADAPPPSSPLVQYVVLRKDLGQGLGWPLGSVCAQAAHAAVAAVWTFKDHDDTRAYCAPGAIDEMRKVVLEVKGEAQLTTLAGRLTEAGVDHKLWMEQPENYPTCLSTRPYRKSEIAHLFKKCNLAKGTIGGGGGGGGGGS
jgi:peptidyl-tRNA hydrolase